MVRQWRRTEALLASGLLLVALLASLWQGPLSAQVSLPGPAANGAAPAGHAGATPAQWWEPSRAYPCGRLWCSEVVLPYLPLPAAAEQVVVAVAITTSRPAEEARTEVERRSRAILSSIDDLVARLHDPPAAAEARRAEPVKPQAAWLFWQRQPPHPRTPQVEVGIENEQTVIYVVGNPERAIAQQAIATVTEADASHAGVTITALAERWRDRFRHALSDALWGIDFDRRHPFGRDLLVVLFLLLTGLVVAALARLGAGLEGLQSRVRQRQDLLENNVRREAMAAFRGGSRGLGPLPAATLANPTVLRQTANLLRLLRRLLSIATVASVMAGAVISLAVFPASRNLAIYLTGQSLVLPLLWLGLIVLQPLLALAVDQGLARWGRALARRDPESNRHELRISTYSKVLHTGVTVLCLLLGLYGTVVLLGVDASILAGAGLVAVAIGFLTRNLLEDILNGALILFTDRFAIGDVITVGDKGGLVEDMNLHVTSLRGSDGQLTTIPNRRIDVVDNLTQRWSRVDFTVRVAADADPRQALAVVESEAQRFWQEPEWQELLMAPPDLLGIDEISHAGTLIRVWIATRPLKQWLVGRQFRLRIKLALQEAGIELGMPQQRIALRQRLAARRGQEP